MFFNKNDLKTGMLVKLQNDDVCIVLQNIEIFNKYHLKNDDYLISLRTGENLKLDFYKSDLTFKTCYNQYGKKDKFNIVEVYKPKYIGDIFKYKNNIDYLLNDKCELIITME